MNGCEKDVRKMRAQMKKPSDAELKEALSEAEKIRVIGDDPYHLSKSLLYLHSRNGMLEEVAAHAERFLRFGLPEDEHAQLRRLLDHLLKETRREAGQDPEHFGL